MKQVADHYDEQPGLCVIINNMEFTHAAELTKQKKDVEDLHKLLNDLRFDVKIHPNLKAQEIIDKIDSYSRMQHKGVFFLVILSHGKLVENRAAVIGTDDQLVSIDELEHFFHATNCPSLRGVPKIFLIDACQGARPLSTSQIQKESGTDSEHFVIIYPSTRSVDGGSILTPAFVAATKKASHDTPFANIIQRVTSNAGQTVEVMYGLTREYYIKRYTIYYTVNAFYWFIL